MELTLSAILYSAFVWWFSTGVIFYLNKRPPRTFRWSVLGGTILMLAALYGLWVSARQETVVAAYTAFTCGLIIWGWHTMTYYMGIITGPRREPCPAQCRPYERFLYAFATGLYHELAIVAKVAIMAWLTWDQPNQFGLWTFLLLWGMHVSAKLNVFLGIRNLNVEFIPDRLAYLTSYFRQRPMNLLFPFSVTAGTILTMWLIQQALLVDAAPYVSIGFVLLATLSALAVIEHWFMLLPIPAEALWRWSLTPSKGAENPTRSELTRSQI